MEKKSFGLSLLLLIVLTSEVMVVPSEGRMCESQSHSFHGTCFSNHNCASVCRNEGRFSGGTCKIQGLHIRCFCTKNC
ncbi:defensin-like protein 1 [Mangifera indica]|uniref:defensin-like protein 1 n=1 Tax=Mangifera indica TaxID=29780 RepID=UPI001CF9D7B0|nr:defensin-like protein 1 [Mangifera indica]